MRTVPVIICVSRSRFWQASPGDHRHAAHWCRAVGGSWSQRSSAVRWPARLRDSSAHAHEDIRSKNRVWAFAGRVRRSYRVAPTRVAGRAVDRVAIVSSPPGCQRESGPAWSTHSRHGPARATRRGARDRVRLGELVVLARVRARSGVTPGVSPGVISGRGWCFLNAWKAARTCR